MIWLIKIFTTCHQDEKFSYPQPQPTSQPPPQNVIHADICLKIKAACAKCEQDRLAAEAEEAMMLKEMEEGLEEEKRMEEVRKAMEIEKRELEWNQRQIQKEKQRAEKQ